MCWSDVTLKCRLLRTYVLLQPPGFSLDFTLRGENKGEPREARYWFFRIGTAYFTEDMRDHFNVPCLEGQSCHRPLSQVSRLLWFCLGFLRQKKYSFALCSTSTSNPVSTHPPPRFLLPPLTTILSMSPQGLAHLAHAGVGVLEPWHLPEHAWWTSGVAQQSQPSRSFCAASGQQAWPSNHLYSSLQ